MADSTILVVDDNEANLKLVRVIMTSEGYNVVSATDAEEAFEQLQHTRPDLILMDLQLPGMDGLELTRRLKSNPATRDIVILAITAYAMKGDRERALAAGCDGYLSKPIDTRRLARIVADSLTSPGKSLPSEVSEESQ